MNALFQKVSESIYAGNINIVVIAVSFIAGVLSFFSPCVLPVIPGYISMLTGLTHDELLNRTKKVVFVTIVNSLLFIAGFTLIFILLQVFLSGVMAIAGKYLKYIFGLLIIIFGLHTIGIFRLKFLYYQKQVNISRKTGLLTSFLMGMAFGFAWTPCTGPILAGILTLASVQEKVWQGTLLLLVYSAGLGIPFLIAGIFMSGFLKFIKKFKRLFRAVEIVSGSILIFIGALILLGRFSSVHSIFR